MSKTRSLTCRYCLAALLFVTQSCLSNDDMDNIEVTGQAIKRASLSDIDITQYTGFAKIIERESFADRFSTVEELLKELPSVQVKQQGGLGSNSEISLRGSKGKQVNLFVDGLLMNSPFNGTASIQSVPTVLLERIEVYPDFTPLNLSNANLAGAVNFHTRHLKQNEYGGQLSLAYGSFQTEQVELSAWGDSKHWQWLGGLNYQAAKNNYPVADSIFRSSEKHRQNDNYRDAGGFFKVAKIMDEHRIQIFVQSSQNHKAVPTILNRKTDAAFTEDSNQRLQNVWDYQGANWQFSQRFSMANEKVLFNDINGTIGLGKEKNISEQQVFSLMNMASFFFFTHELTASINLERNNFKQEDKLLNQSLLKGNRNTFILAIADNWHMTEKVMLNATIRQIWLEESMNYLADSKPKASERETHQSGQLGFSFQIAKSLTIKTNIGRSIRIPYIFEKYGNLGAFKGNKDLKVEQADVVDAGFILDFNQYRLSTSIFYKDIKNGIYTIFDSRGVGHPMNIGFSKIAGIELDTFFQPLSWLEITSYISLLDSINNSNIKSHQNHYMPGIYHHNAGLSVSFFNHFFRYSNSLHYYDKLYYDPANAVIAQQQTVWNSSLTFYFKHVNLDITGRNLSNKNFMDYNRMPTPGRSLIATITINF